MVRKLGLSDGADDGLPQKSGKGLWRGSIRSGLAWDYVFALARRAGPGSPVRMIPEALPAPAIVHRGDRHLRTQLDAVPAVPCPCGQARRGFAVPGNELATIHLVDISADARTHYHRRMTEIYLILEGEGFIELDGERVPARPMLSVMIQPGCRHRLVGRFRIVNVAIPAFDPADEWFD